MRSAWMVWAVVWARVCRRLGIITPRWLLVSTAGGSPVHRVAVGSQSFGNRCKLPVGLVQMMCRRAVVGPANRRARSKRF